MPVTTRRSTSRSAAASTCPASSDSGSLGDTRREKLGEALVGLARSDLHAGRDHCVALLLGAEDGAIAQLGHAVMLDQRHLDEAVALRHVAEEERVDETLRTLDLTVR